MASRAAIEGVSNDSGLVWTLDSARVRVLIPDAASGASWTDEAMFLRPLLPLLAPTMRDLEIGCGAGRIARHVAPHVRELVCADVSNILLDEARTHLATHPNVRCSLSLYFSYQWPAPADSTGSSRGTGSALVRNPRAWRPSWPARPEGSRRRLQ